MNLNKFIRFSGISFMYLSFAPIILPFFQFQYSYIPVILSFPILFIFYKNVPYKLIFVFLLLLLNGLVKVWQNFNTSSELTKVWLSCFIFYIFYARYYEAIKYKHEIFFEDYLKTALIVCYIGFFQIISYAFGFTYGYDYSWLVPGAVRSYSGSIVDEGILGMYPIHSLFGEPANFAAALAPAGFFALISLMTSQKYHYNRSQSLIILLGLILSTSSVAYIGMFFSIFIIAINYLSKKNFLAVVFFSLIISALSFYGLYVGVLKFRERVDSAIFLLTFQQTSSNRGDLLQAGSSVMTLYNNFVVAVGSVEQNPCFGSGLGSHSTSYPKYSFLNIDDGDYGLNYNDANSLFNRILSESGVLGVIAFIIPMFFFFVKRNNKNLSDIRWVYSGACLTIIFSFLLRNGHYFGYGFPFYILCFFNLKKIGKDEPTIGCK
jgi:hypothetical protein